MRRPAGFTMVELVVVLILIGIVSAVAIPKMTNMNDFRARGFRDGITSALRYAQKTATSHRRAVCVAFTASTVTLTIVDTSGSTDCTKVQPLPLPNGAASVVSGDTTNVVISAADPKTLNFTFLSNGIGADRTISIAGQADINVVGATGYVQ